MNPKVLDAFWKRAVLAPTGARKWKPSPKLTAFIEDLWDHLECEESCPRNGAQQFWLVDLQRRSVNVIRAGGYSSIHDAAGVMEAGTLGGVIAVRDIAN